MVSEQERLAEKIYRDRLTRLVGSTIRTVHGWLHMCRRPSIVVPDFQRPFVWSDDQTLDLLTSLLDGYPIGTFMTWDFRDREPSDVVIGGVRLGRSTPRGSYLIDGQQRTGSLVRAFLGRRFAYDTTSHRVVVNAEPHSTIFPLSLAVRQGTPMQEWIKSAPVGGQYAAYSMLSLLDTPLFAVDCDSGWPLERVLDAYRKINTMGTRMSVEEIDAGVRRSMMNASRDEHRENKEAK